MILKAFLPAVTKSHAERRILPTHPMHLFRIIQDVDEYSQFLPLCTHSKVTSRSSDARSFEATLTVGFPPLFRETYVSQVTLKPEIYTIETNSIQSKLFESLKSRWKLTERANNQCEVDFWVEMTVRDPLISATLDQVLRHVAVQQVTAFSERCQQVSVRDDLAQESFPEQ